MIFHRNNYKIKLGLINFTNCLPLNYTLEKWQLENIELVYGNPAQLNKLMAEGVLDVAPVSSIEYLKNKNKYKLIETACISSDGECGSVILFSKKELNKIDKIALPDDSASSIAMLKIILDRNDIIYSKHNYEKIDSSHDAVLFIGDNALKKNNSENDYLFSYDIGKLWKERTGYPAVFGTWVRKEDNFHEFDNLIHKAIETGLELYFNEILDLASSNLKLSREIIRDYLKSKISYKYTERHRKSLEKIEESCSCSFSGYNSTNNPGI